MTRPDRTGFIVENLEMPTNRADSASGYSPQRKTSWQTTLVRVYELSKV